MLNELIQLFTTGQSVSSETYYNATQSLHEFLTSADVVKAFPQVSENLGDQLPNLRKASHQLFQAFVRTNGTFDPVISAMLSRGLIHPNWIVRQKNVNSLQSLLLSEGKLLDWNSHLVKPLIETMINKLYDQHSVVIKATEQTFLSFIQLSSFKVYYSNLSVLIQSQIDQFVQRMKEANYLQKDFMFSSKMLQSPPKQIALPFEQQDLDDLNDTQWQIRGEAISNILNSIPPQLNQIQIEQLLDRIMPMLQDHNFNIIINALNIIQKCVQLLERPIEHIQELQCRLSDGKSAVRGQVRQILILYLTKLLDNDLLQLIFNNLDQKSVTHKEEVLDLATELCTRNRLLLSNNLELTLKSIAALVDDQKTKLRMKTIETLVILTQINPVLAQNILQQSLARAFYEMYLDRLNNGKQSSQIEFSSASTRSDLTQNTIATRMKNKQVKEEEIYVPSSLTKSANQRTIKEARDSQISQQEPERTTKQIKNMKPKSQQLIEDEVEQISTKATFTKPFQNLNLNNTKFEADKTFQPTYLEELQPLEKPEQMCKTVMNDLKYDEWSRQFEGLNGLRRLAKNHQDILKQSQQFQSILQELVKLIESLRSGVAKNALITLNELSVIYKKDLDIVMDNAIQKLIKKAIDSNQFISEEVRRVTVSLFSNCSESRCMQIAPQVYQSKSSQVKVNLAYAFNALLNKKVEQQTYEKLVYYLCHYVCDQSQEVRTLAKEGLLGREDVVMKVAPEQDFRRIMGILGKGTGQSFRRMGSTSDKMGNRTPEARTPDVRNRTPNNKVKLPMEFEMMPQHFLQGETAKDWKMRLESIDFLYGLAKKYTVLLVEHKYANRFLDFVSKAINDANTKVALHSCENFISLVEPLKIAIQGNCNNVWNGVFQAMSSNNNSVRQSAEQLFLELGTYLDIQFSLPQVVHLIIFGPTKAKGQAISMLAEFIPNFYEEKPQLIVKHLLPLAKKLQDESKPEIKHASQKIFRQLQQTCPDIYMKLGK